MSPYENPANTPARGIDDVLPDDEADEEEYDGGEEAAEPRRRHSQAAAVARDILNWLVIPILIVIILRCFVFGMYVIPSGSMLETMQIGDRVMTNRITAARGDVKRGDVIVFADPAGWLSTRNTGETQYLTKRVIGVAGDTVSCAGAGSPVIVNGVAIDESSYLRPGVNPSDFAFEITVTDGNLFVMGDNRSNSADSRYHSGDGNNGLVPVSDVVGIAFCVYWPVSDWHGLGGGEKAFANVPDATASAGSGTGGSGSGSDDATDESTDPAVAGTD